MSSRLLHLCGVGMFAGALAAGAIELDWAYHAQAGQDNRVTENVPGQTLTFLGNGSTEISNDEPVILYVLTLNQFAGDADEQVFVRWWNGKQEHWVMASWAANVLLGSEGEGAGRFHDKPDWGTVMLDLWKIEIDPKITRPGDNYYVIQLKAFSERGTSEFYLMRDAGTASAQVNNLGQAWTAEPEYIGHDWSVRVKE